MESLPVEMANWVEEQKLPITPGALEPEGVTIAHCIPPVFDHYCKVFHPFEINLDLPETMLSERAYREANTRDVSIYQDPEKAKKLRPVHKKFTTWQEVAGKFGLQFHKEISIESFQQKIQSMGWPANLLFPKEGFLPRPVLMELLQLIKAKYTGSVIIYQMAPNTIQKDGKFEDLVQCSLDQVLDYFPEDFVGYLYAADKSWIVYTSTDLHFTIVGGNKELIGHLTHGRLEALECEQTTRVDNKSDHINLD